MSRAIYTQGVGPIGPTGAAGPQGSTGSAGASYTFSFDSSYGSIFTVTHNLNSLYNSVSVYDNDGYIVNPDQIRTIDANSIEINIVSAYVIPGVWKVVVVAGGGSTGGGGGGGGTGPQGAQGAQGAQGFTGTAGPQGSQGNSGTAGAQGAQGATGNNGATGAQGAQGSAGTNGTAGAQGAQGSQGATGSGVPGWTSAGTIQSVGWGGTTTAPTVGTTTKNNLSYRQLGNKEWEVVMSFSTTGAGATTGNGDYLFTLPNSLSFDTTLSWQQVYTGSVNASSPEFQKNNLPMSFGQMSDGTTNTTICYIVPYSSTQFRIIAYVFGSGLRAWSSAWFQLTNAVGGNWSFKFTST